MTSLTLVAVLALAVAGRAVRLWILARRAEHLVVLRLDGGTFLLARQPEGRYLLIDPFRAPAALARFEVLRARERWHGLRAALARPPRWSRTAAHLQ